MNLTAIDVALILFRHLLSLESNICIAEGTITTEETAFYKAACSNIGWDRKEDYAVKQRLVKKLLGIQEPSSDDIYKANFKFEDIFDHPKLPLLMKHHADFNIASKMTVEKMVDKPDTAWELYEVDAETLAKFNRLVWDGVLEIDHFVNRRFSGVKRGKLIRSHFSARPRFFSILYEPQIKFRTISEMQTFKMKGSTLTLKEEEGKWVCDHTTRTYVLCAIVGLGDKYGLEDDVRTYADEGSEIIPREDFGGQTGNGATGSRWSILNKGRYMLFYHRITNREGDQILMPKTDVSADNPEFRSRSPSGDATPRKRDRAESLRDTNDDEDHASRKMGLENSTHHQTSPPATSLQHPPPTPNPNLYTHPPATPSFSSRIPSPLFLPPSHMPLSHHPTIHKLPSYTSPPLFTIPINTHSLLPCRLLLLPVQKPNK